MPDAFYPDAGSHVALTDFVGWKRVDSGQPNMTRQEIVAELQAAGFQIASVSGRAVVVGLAYKRQRRPLKVENGKIVKT